MTFSAWGPVPELETPLAESEILARVVEEQRTQYRLADGDTIYLGQLAGKFLRPDVGRLDRPVVGDWVVARAYPAEGKAVVQRVLPRRSLLKRRAAGEDESVQPLAANVDWTCIVTSMNRDFNPRRLDRYLVIAAESGSRPVVLLTKSDLEPASVALAEELKAKHNVPCLSLSALTGEGLAPVSALFAPGETVVFVGSSGVGKSTLVNALLGRAEQSTAAVREDDDRGRHTTTSRRLLPLTNGALVIDTPGLREIQLDGSQEEGLAAGGFALVESLAAGCRFANCGHESEPGCAVKAALEEGTLEAAAFQSYLKLRKEVAHQARKNDKGLAAEEKKKWKKIHVELHDRKKIRGKGK